MAGSGKKSSKKTKKIGNNVKKGSGQSKKMTGDKHTASASFSCSLIIKSGVSTTNRWRCSGCDQAISLIEKVAGGMCAMCTKNNHRDGGERQSNGGQGTSHHNQQQRAAR